MITLEVKVPIVWQQLINTVFEEGKDYPRGDEQDHAMDDPTPMVDDDRSIEVMGEGYRFILGLASGQNNYYGYYELIIKKDGLFPIMEEDILGTFCDLDFPDLGFNIVINWKT